MVTDQHHGTRGEVFAAGLYFETYAGGQGHAVVECARGGPLRDSMLPEQAEEEGGEDAVGGAGD